MSNPKHTALNRLLLQLADALSAELTPKLGAKGIGYMLVLVEPTTGQHIIRSNGDKFQVEEMLFNAIGNVSANNKGRRS